MSRGMLWWERSSGGGGVVVHGGGKFKYGVIEPTKKNLGGRQGWSVEWKFFFYFALLL